MSIAELRSNNILHAMKSGQKVGKPEEGTDSLDNYIRQAIGKEPVLSFSRAESNHVQWIQLLHALDQQDLPGWPLLSPPKAQMQKCDKCTKEFCSPINYRRHIRVHRRSLKIDKDSTKNRDFLGAFWDKLSLDEAKEVASFKNVTLEEVPGSSIIKSLASFIRKPGFSSLPQVYVKAGAALLDVVQARPSRFPISSQELFNILDDASEKTFLCAGTAESIQKFVFDGEAGKIGLEMKNLVACTSFLMEQKLVKAWHADKDAEALRCEKLLVEEEEAAQKRQADILERRRLKKLRQKEQKAKEQTEEDEEGSKEEYPSSLEGLPSYGESLGTSNWQDVTDQGQQNLEPNSVSVSNQGADSRCLTRFDDAHIDSASYGFVDSTNCHIGDHRVQQGSCWRHQIVTRRPVSSSHRGRNGFHPAQSHVVTKLGPAQKQVIHKEQRAACLASGHKDQRTASLASGHKDQKSGPLTNGYKDQKVGSLPSGYKDQKAVSLTNGHKDQRPVSVTNGHKDQRPVSVTNGHKIWTRKTKPDNESENLNARVEREPRDEPEVLWIGSISVPLRDSNDWCQGAILAQCAAIEKQPPRPKSGHEKHAKSDSGHIGANKAMVKLWRPVGRLETANTMTVEDLEKEVDLNTNTRKVANSHHDRNLGIRMESGNNPRGVGMFSSSDAEAFLAQRWKEAIAAEHVRLVLSPETEPPDSSEGLNPGILCSAENRLPSVGSSVEAVTTPGSTKTKAEKNGRLKYIPKQKKNK